MSSKVAKTDDLRACQKHAEATAAIRLERWPPAFRLLQGFLLA
jgi:hypothetical protein